MRDGVGYDRGDDYCDEFLSFCVDCYGDGRNKW